MADKPSQGDSNTNQAKNADPGIEVRDTVLPDEVLESQVGGLTPPVEGSIPKTFGRYHILKTLGQGAMGSVYLAEDTQLERKIALKIPKFSVGDGPDVLQRFYREARASATLRSPNICPVYDVGEIDGTHYISMAYIDGQPLSHYIKPDVVQPERQITLTVRKLAQALELAHKEGVVHRDLKPANIMVDSGGEPVIMDFGLARQMYRQESERLTQSGMIMGSPAYMSPEQVEGNIEAMGPACDIYSLGIIFYELLTSQLPFSGSIVSVLAGILTVEPKKPSELREDLDPRLEEICQKMMAKKAEDRFGSMSEISAALTAVLRTAKPQPKAKEKPTATASKSSRKSQAKKTGKPSPKKTIPDKPKQRKSATPAITESSVDALLRTAKKCMQKRDYAQTAQVLRQIPEKHRTDEIVTLLEKAETLQDDVDFLLADIQESVQKKDHETLLPQLKELLKLKPGHQKAKRLYEELATSKKGGRGGRFRARRKRSATIFGSLLSDISTPFGMAIAGGMLAIGLMTWAITSYLRDDGDGINASGNPVPIAGATSNPAANPAGLSLTPTEILTSPDWEWTPPVNLGPVVNSPAYDEGSTFSPDGLTFIFNSRRVGGSTTNNLDIWQCTRTRVDAPWSKPVCIGPNLIAGVTDANSNAAFSADSKTLYFTAYVSFDTGASDIWKCTRTGPLAAWSKAVKLKPPVNSPGNELHPHISTDGKTLFFNSERQKRGGTHRLWVSTRSDLKAAWSQPVQPDVGLPKHLVGFTPCLSRDGLTILVGAGQSNGSGNIWMATRNSPNGPFSSAKQLSPVINSQFRDFYPVLSADGKTLIFSSDRPGGQGDADLWMSRRVPKAGVANRNTDRTTAEWVLSMGGIVKTDAGEFKAGDQLPSQPFLVGSINLDGKQQVTDNNLARLSALTNLRVLALGNTQLSDVGLKHLSGLTQLSYLSLGNTSVSDVGLVHLKRMTKLTELSLNFTQVSDTGLKHLTGMMDLTELHLERTKVTAAGVATLRKSLPNCQIIYTENGRIKTVGPNAAG